MSKSNKAPMKGIPIIVYPPGVKDITQDLSKDELIRRLKMLARAFQDMEQEEEISQYEPLAKYLVEPFFVKHSSKDVRLLVACCIADIFRIFAPEAPFTTVEQLKMIFLFINKQLWGLENVEGPSWKRYFYLLENLAMVKSYNICMELEDANEIFVELFTIFFSIISDSHTPKVRTFMLDVMCPLISENDAVPQDLLEIILANLLDSKKIENPLAFQLGRDLIRRTASTIEPSIQQFFNNILILGRTSESEMSNHSYELIYQLNTISSSLLLSVLPQLEFKLKSNDEKERLQVTKLLGRMFSDKESDLISQNKPLWNCFLGRFSDINTEIRATCVKLLSLFLLYHSYVRADLVEKLKIRAHDTDEGVRQDVVSAIVSAAKKDISKISDDMLIVIKERTLDKKWKIRKEAVLGLSHIYKKWYHNADISRTDYERLKWIKNKLLHMYYQTNIEDRLLVERIFTSNLVPYTLDVQDRMKRLFQLFATVDQHAVKAIMELMKCQHLVRSHVRELMALYHKDKAKEKDKLLLSKLVTISKYLPEPSKAQEHLKKLSEILNEDLRIRGYMNHVVDPDVTCKKATQAVGEVMKKFGNPKNPTPIYETIRTLMERISPLMIDSSAVKELIAMVADQLDGKGEEYDEEPDESPTVRGLKLLQTLSVVFPNAYKTSEARELLMALLENDDEDVSDIALQIFISTGHGLEKDNPQIASSLMPMLMSKARTGTKVQAKNAVKCIGVVAANRQAVYKMIFESCSKCLTLDHENFETSLVSLGHIAKLAPQQFALPMKNVIAASIVKGLLMQDVTDRSHIKGIWCVDELVSEETRVKMCAIKTIIHWLQGMRSNQHGSATSTLRLLTQYLKNEGDLMERDKASKAEMSRLRLAAGCAMLKIAQESCYSELINLEQFQLLALLINDECYQVRERFAKKLNKGLISLRLPLSYMAIFSLCAKDPVRESRTTAKQYIQRNIQTRREYLKTRTVQNSQMLSLLPEYVIPYAIHLLAHDPDFTTLRDIEALNDIKECLWFMLEPLVNRNENCSFIRKLVENIKRTKDAQTQDDKSSHKRMYAVCDIVLGLLLTRTPTYSLKEHPGDVLLPKRLFVKPRKAINSHMESYLPKKLQEEFNKVPGEEKKNPTDKLLESPAQKGRGKKQNTSATQDTSKDDSTAGKGAKKNQKVEKKNDENTPKPATPKKGTRSTAATATAADASVTEAATTSNTSATTTKNDKKISTRGKRGALAEKKITNNEQDGSQSTVTSESSSTPKSPVGKRKLKPSKKQASSQSSQDSQDSSQESPAKRRRLDNNKNKATSSQESELDSSPAPKGNKSQSTIKKFMTRNKSSKDSPSSSSSTQSSPAPKRGAKRQKSEESPTKPVKKSRTDSDTKAVKKVKTNNVEKKRTESKSGSTPKKKKGGASAEAKPSPRPSSSTSSSSQSSTESPVKRRLLNGQASQKRLGTRSSTKSTRSGRTRMESPMSTTSSSTLSSPAVPSPKKLPSKPVHRTMSSSSKRQNATPTKKPSQNASPTKKAAQIARPAKKTVENGAPTKKSVQNGTRSARVVQNATPTKKTATSSRNAAPSPRKPVSSPAKPAPSPKKLTPTESQRKFASKKRRAQAPDKYSPEIESPKKKVLSPNRTLVQRKLTAFTTSKKVTSTPKVSSSPLKKLSLTGKKDLSPVKKAKMRIATKRTVTRGNSQSSSSSSSVSSPGSISSSPRKTPQKKSVNLSPVKKAKGNARKNLRHVKKAGSRLLNGTSDGESSQGTSDEDSQTKRSKRLQKTTASKASPKKKAPVTSTLNTSRKSRRRKP